MAILFKGIKCGIKSLKLSAFRYRIKRIVSRLQLLKNKKNRYSEVKTKKVASESKIPTSFLSHVAGQRDRLEVRQILSFIK